MFVNKVILICLVSAVGIFLSCTNPNKDSTQDTEGFSDSVSTTDQKYKPVEYLITSEKRNQTIHSKGSTTRKKYNKLLSQGIIDTLFKTKANDLYDYSIFEISNQGSSQYMGIEIFKTERAEDNIELIYLSENKLIENPSKIEKDIDLTRIEWMKRCNAHEVTELVEGLYTHDAIYYNHKPLIIGTDAITKTYSYMANENYSLQLSPLFFKLMNPSTAFEIGQCSGSYNGKYILVWSKTDRGWQVAFDSNI